MLKFWVPTILMIISLLAPATTRAQQMQLIYINTNQMFTSTTGVYCNTTELAQRVVERQQAGRDSQEAALEISKEVGNDSACWFESYLFAPLVVVEENGKKQKLSASDGGRIGHVQAMIQPIIVIMPIKNKDGSRIPAFGLQYGIFLVKEERKEEQQ